MNYPGSIPHKLHYPPGCSKKSYADLPSPLLNVTKGDARRRARGGTLALPPAEANHLASAHPLVRSWMDDIRDYLKEKFLPDDNATAERIVR
jgi:hypothetical protein